MSRHCQDIDLQLQTGRQYRNGFGQCFYLHYCRRLADWTAGHYEDVYDDYHLNIGPGGEMYLTCKTFIILLYNTLFMPLLSFDFVGICFIKINII